MQYVDCCRRLTRSPQVQGCAQRPLEYLSHPARLPRPPRWAARRVCRHESLLSGATVRSAQGRHPAGRQRSETRSRSAHRAGDAPSAHRPAGSRAHRGRARRSPTRWPDFSCKVVTDSRSTEFIGKSGLRPFFDSSLLRPQKWTLRPAQYDSERSDTLLARIQRRGGGGGRRIRRHRNSPRASPLLAYPDLLANDRDVGRRFDTDADLLP